MNIFDELGEIYNDIDSEYAIKEITARSKGHIIKETGYNSKRKFNDQAYFLFMFTRLEDRVRSLSDQLINERMATLSDWKLKRSWDIINAQKDKDSLHFMSRVSLLLQKGCVNYNLVNQYYRQRNNIGHGGTFTITISIPNVITDMQSLYKELSK